MATYMPQVGQIGSQLDSAFFLFDDCIVNGDRIPLEEYERMLDTDETVETAMLFLMMAVLMKLGKYEHPDKKIALFVNENFEMMEGNLHTALEDVLSALWAGFSGTEIVWRPSGDRIMLERLVTYHPRTMFIRVDRETGRYAGIKQWRWFAGSPVDIPIPKTILYTYRKKFGNYYGRSMLAPVRKNWLLKDPILKMMARALDRFGTPFTSAIVPDEYITDPDNPSREISQLEYAVRLLSNIQSGTGLAFRYGGDGQEPKVNVHNTGGTGVGESFVRALNHLDKRIARGMLAPSLLMDDSGKTGSYALGKAHFTIFDIMTSGIFRGLGETLIEQLVARMIDYNFGEQRDYGRFTERQLTDEDTKVISDVFRSLTSDGYLEPDVQEDFDAVRERLGLPSRKVVSPQQRLRMRVKTEYANYTRGSGDIGDPLAGEGDE